MTRIAAVALAFVLTLAPEAALARGGGHGGAHSSGSHSSSRSSGSSHTSGSSHSGGHHSGANSHSATKNHTKSSSPGGAHRSSGHGKTKRDPKQRAAFQKSHPCPSTGKTSGACPGYVVDHVTPLKRGGADSPSNMQWQTTSAGKAKDKWE